jgi:hypothetical protein
MSKSVAYPSTMATGSEGATQQGARVVPCNCEALHILFYQPGKHALLLFPGDSIQLLQVSLWANGCISHQALHLMTPRVNMIFEGERLCAPYTKSFLLWRDDYVLPYAKSLLLYGERFCIPLYKDPSYYRGGSHPMQYPSGCDGYNILNPAFPNM